MTTLAPNLDSTHTSNGSNSPTDNNWVVDILHDENLQLARAKRLEPYGRAHLSPFVKRLLWTMRIYVIASFFLIAAQLLITLKAQSTSPQAPATAVIVTQSAPQQPQNAAQ